MNNLGVHALVWVGGWSEAEATRAIEASARIGYDLIEVPLLDPASVDTDATRSLLDTYGMDAACSLGLTHDTDISSEDPAVVHRGHELLADAIAVSRDLGSSYLGGVIFSALGRYSSPPSPRGRQHCLATLSSLAGRAADAGVTLGLEVVNRYESNVVNTAEQALELIDEIGSPNLTVHLDTYHMNIEEPDFSAPVRLCGDRLGYVHVGESHRGYLGTGTVDFPEFFAALRRLGYGGTVTFESFSSKVVHPSLSSNLAIWREPWTDSEDLARSALDFVRAGLNSAG